MDMRAQIASNSPSVAGTLTYYINPSQVVQKAVDASSDADTITLAAGAYNQNVKINKPVTVRGQGVTGSITSAGAPTNGGKNYVNAKEVFIRADDYTSMNADWTWFIGLTGSKDISETIAVIPLQTSWNSAAQLTNSIDKNKIEIATHGYNHENFAGSSYDQQYSLLSQATNLMTAEFWRPRTFVAPYYADDANTVAACKALGYHSISGNYVDGTTGIQQFVMNYAWETDWSDPNNVPHQSFDNFKTTFDDFYSGNWGFNQFTLVLHPNTFTDTSGNLKTADANTFEQSIDYMKSLNVEFMTMDQAYKWNN
jgi:peptidoglycan/xylan/chitin deacetylase (PgdA/CDA1 family)